MLDTVSTIVAALCMFVTAVPQCSAQNKCSPVLCITYKWSNVALFKAEP